MTFSALQQNSLVRSLLSLSREQFSGSVKVNAFVTATQRDLECFLFWQQGRLTFADRSMPTPREFVLDILRRLKIRYGDSLLQYAANRVNLEQSSFYEVLEVIINTKAINWADVERIIMERIISLIENFLPYSCTLQLDQKQKLDIAKHEYRGLSWVDVLRIIEKRQQEWQKFLSLIPSLDAIPQVCPGVMNTLDHLPTRKHLQQWVNGKRSFIEIAETIGTDPLSLAPIYCHWVSEGIIQFFYGEATVTQQNLPVVLSVDDSPIMQTMLCRYLKDNYEVITASSAIDALAILRQREINLILLDVTMPEIDGLEFCRTIRKINKLKDIPVVMLTAKDGLIDRAMAHLAGTNRYLTKPIDRDELLSVIRELI